MMFICCPDTAVSESPLAAPYHAAIAKPYFPATQNDSADPCHIHTVLFALGVGSSPDLDFWPCQLASVDSPRPLQDSA